MPTPLRLLRSFLLLLALAIPAMAADPGWQPLVGAFATFQAPPSMARNTETRGGDGNLEIFECPEFSLTFQSGTRTLPKELQTDLDKAIARWSAEFRKNWKVNAYLEDDQHLAYAAIRTVEDPTFRDPRAFHLSFGLAAGDNPFSIHIRFQRPQDLIAVEHLLQSLKLKTQ